MSGMGVLNDYGRMANYLFQVNHGHIVVQVEGRPCLLDSGAPFSVGYEPINIAGTLHPVEMSYMGVTCSYLSEHTGTPIEGMIGADIIREYNLGLFGTEGMIQFNHLRPSGEIILPVQECFGIPVISVFVNGRVRRMFFDTGAPTSLLVPEALEGLTPIGRHEDFYPMLGHFQTDSYSLEVALGSQHRELRFGCVPDELRSILEVANVDGMIGTELLRYFGMTLSLRDKTLHLEASHRPADIAVG